MTSHDDKTINKNLAKLTSVFFLLFLVGLCVILYFEHKQISSNFDNLWFDNLWRLLAIGASVVFFIRGFSRKESSCWRPHCIIFGLFYLAQVLLSMQLVQNWIFLFPAVIGIAFAVQILKKP